jgi:type IV pilus assembly protein PilM
MNLNLGFGSQTLLVIDPGRHTLKIGVGSLGSKGKWSRLQAVYTVATGATPQTTPDQVIERLGELIQEVLKRHSLSAKQVSFAIPGRASFVRQLKVPRVSGDRLRRLIQYEARQQIPFPIEDIILDSHVFEAEGPEVGVTLVAVRRTIIDQYCSMLKTAGLVPDTIDVTTLSLFDAFYPSLKKEEEEVVALVDIGASTTDIIVCKRGRVEFIRTAPQAGDHLTKALADQMGLEWEAAEELKVSIGELDSTIDRTTDPLAYGEKDQAARVRVFLSKAFDGISNEIRRTLDFYVSQPDGEPIGKIFLTGGASRCPGIARFIGNRLGIACEVKSPFEGTLVNVETLQAEPLETTASILLGLCQRNISDVPLRMNFLPPAIVRQKEFEKRRAILAAEGILLTFLIGFSVVTMGQNIDVFQNASDDLQRQVEGRSDVAKQIGEYIENTRRIEERVIALRDIGLSRGVVSQTMSEIAEKIPLGETWLKSLDIDTTSLKLQVRGDSEESMIPFKEQMKEAPRLRETLAGDLKMLGPDGVGFTFSAKVEKNPSQELSKLRGKLDTRGIKPLDVTLEVHAESETTKQAAVTVTMPEAFNEAERSNMVQDILHAVADADLGFQRCTVSIVFHNAQRKPTGRYDIEQEAMQALLQGNMQVKDLTLKPPTEG